MFQLVGVCMMVRMMTIILMILTVYVTVQSVSIGTTTGYYWVTECLGSPPDNEHI
jgi:hypothetical protein